MRIVYYSSLFFTDCDFPLIKRFQENGDEVLYLIEVVYPCIKGGLFNLKHKLPQHGIINGLEIQDFNIYKEYIDLTNVWLVVRNQHLANPINWWTYLNLLYKIWNYSFDVIHVSVLLGASESLLYLFRKKMVLTVHDPFVHFGEESSKGELKRRFAFKHIPKLILLNKSQKADFIKRYDIKESRVFYNKLGVYECLKYLSSHSKLRSKVNYGNYVLFFGHISPYKGIEVLCKAMTIVHNEYKTLKCIIAGKGTFDFDIEAYRDGGNIIVKNYFIEITELAELISKAVCVVCPYIDATQSGVIASSFALSKPVIASDVGGLRESVADGVSGLLVPPNDSDALAEAILRIFQDDSLVELMRNNIGRIWGKGENSWEYITEEYRKIYNS